MIADRFLALTVALACATPLLLPRVDDAGPVAKRAEAVSVAAAAEARAQAPADQPSPGTGDHPRHHGWALPHFVTEVSALLSDSPAPEERCLAQAIYFEARSESLQGQLAVANVVLNRVENGAWPETICKVVFQNEQWRNRCQFSFACDGLSDRPKEPEAWRRARAVAAIALADAWPDVTGKATHYHATYVAPTWRHHLEHTVRHGQHLFYRGKPPRVLAADLR